MRNISRASHRTLTAEPEISAYLNRTRMDMLRVLCGGPATMTQVARQLGVHPANLIRHIRKLQEAGLVKLVEKRDTGRNLEKYYVATASSFDVAPEADALTSPQKTALAFARSELSASLARLPDDPGSPVQVHVVGALISADQQSQFLADLQALAERFRAADHESGDPVHLVLALYPGDPEAIATKNQIKLTRVNGDE
jgi:DNA-binding transcriptional ArsR family regulator